MRGLGLSISNARTLALLAGLLVTLLNVVFIVTEQYWGLLLPFILGIVALGVFALDKVLLFLVVATPLSVFYMDERLHLGMSLPTEPLLVGLLILLLARIFYYAGFDRRVASHPLAIALLAYLFWVFVTSITSTMPWVSFKFFLARTWFIGVFFFLFSQLFREKKNLYRVQWLYLVPLAAVVLYALVRLGQYGLENKASEWVMSPFFKEHTSYAAVLALYVPVAVCFTFMPRQNLNRRLSAGLISLVLLAGLVLSYSRAAWLGLMVASLAGLLIYYRVLGMSLLIGVLVGGGLFWHYQEDILMALQENTATSDGGIEEHVESVSNITTDDSNLERINRWKSAWRMFEDRPWFGHGPGTYMFRYAPYQKTYDMTLISTNAGDRGNAHSEFLGPLSEMGWPGPLFVAAIVLLTLLTGIRTYHRMPAGRLKWLTLALLIGLISYWVHGTLNNFLSLDKAALPVWSFSAALVVLDRYHRKL